MVFAFALAGSAGAFLLDRRIDIDIRDADVRHVLRLLADTADLNIVFTEEVSGKVTLRLRNVPWISALRVVLKAKGLEAEWRDNILYVAPAETFAKERQQKIDARRQCQENARLKTRFVRLSYARAEEMAPLVKATLSERGDVQVDKRTNTLIIRDVDCPD